MLRPVHPSFGWVKFVMDGQEFNKTGITSLSMVTPVLLRLYDGLYYGHHHRNSVSYQRKTSHIFMHPCGP